MQEPRVAEAHHLDQFPLAPMGALAPGSAQARPSAQPPIQSFGTLGQLLELPPLVRQIIAYQYADVNVSYSMYECQCHMQTVNECAL